MANEQVCYTHGVWHLLLHGFNQTLVNVLLFAFLLILLCSTPAAAVAVGASGDVPAAELRHKPAKPRG
jgi:hypothetical protein